MGGLSFLLSVSENWLQTFPWTIVGISHWRLICLRQISLLGLEIIYLKYRWNIQSQKQARIHSKIEKASEMQQPSCKSNSFGQTGFLFSRFINVMCQVSIFWYCWFTRRRFLNIKIINHIRPPLGPPDIPNITLEEDHARNIWAKFG